MDAAGLEVPFSLLDVFTRQRFVGNPLAVITDARGMSDAAMQATAREFGFSETTFVLPAASADATARVRIFTPHAEIPFAGHPNVGTAFVLGLAGHALGRPVGEVMTFEEMGGNVAVALRRQADEVIGAEIAAPQGLERLGRCEPALIARCLGLPQSSLVTTRLAPSVASIGLPFAFAELSDLSALAGITPDLTAFAEAAEQGPMTVDGFALCAFVVIEEGPPLAVRSRVLSPLGHPPEDPATGSASGALASLLASPLVENRSVIAGEIKVEIEQGVEMGRPSQISVALPVEQGTLGLARLSGECVLVGQGSLQVGGQG